MVINNYSVKHEFFSCFVLKLNEYLVSRIHLEFEFKSTLFLNTQHSFSFNAGDENFLFYTMIY